MKKLISTTYKIPQNLPHELQEKHQYFSLIFSQSVYIFIFVHFYENPLLIWVEWNRALRTDKWQDVRRAFDPKVKGVKYPTKIIPDKLRKNFVGGTGPAKTFS